MGVSATVRDARLKHKKFKLKKKLNLHYFYQSFKFTQRAPLHGIELLAEKFGRSKKSDRISELVFWFFGNPIERQNTVFVRVLGHI